MDSIGSFSLHTDCLHFRGDLPCKPHKQHGYECVNCPAYSKIEHTVLIIKLGAIGDVIRTTPLIHKLRLEYPNAKITWLTLTPSILPSTAIDQILPFTFQSVIYLNDCQFDVLINLDKDKEACALANSIQAKKKFGYVLKDGIPYPANDLAHHKYSTGLFDSVSKANTKSYVQEIFELNGWEFNGEEYIFENHADKGYTWNLPEGKPLIGLNTGCGDRWTTRLWSTEKWIALIEGLIDSGYMPVLLGGEQEDNRNKELSERTGASYLGYFSLQQFINLMDQMDVVVTQVTMAMHIAVALKKKLVLMNNIFNPHEFELYGRGVLVSPEKECVCYFSGTCKNGTSCMENLEASTVLNHVNQLIGQGI